jgi:DNA invertase Pin-like site-specific DNA recombinase
MIDLFFVFFCLVKIIFLAFALKKYEYFCRIKSKKDLNTEDFLMQYGYSRVSTKEQHSDRQFSALTAAGVEPKNIFTDKISGKDFERPQYKKLLKKLKSGDRLIVKSLDRLGRNYKEIVEQWQIITKDLGADIIILDMPLLNTTIYRDLLGTLISDMVLQILSFVAQNEREVMLTRQAEGIVEAKKRGVKFGRPKKTVPSDFAKIKKDYLSKKISSRKAAEKLHISQTTFFNWLNFGDI